MCSGTPFTVERFPLPESELGTASAIGIAAPIKKTVPTSLNVSYSPSIMYMQMLALIPCACDTDHLQVADIPESTVKIRRFYGKIHGIWLPVLLPLFFTGVYL